MSTVVASPAAKYATETEAEHFAWWCEEYLRHSVDRFTGKPFVFERWQRDWLDELLSLDGDEPYWKSTALVVSRKNGKTTMLAALALYRLLEDEGKPEILLAAGGEKQAAKLFEGVLDFLRQNPELDARVHRREHIGQIVNPENGGVIHRVAASGDKLDGFNPSLIVVDELHGFNTPTLRRSWAALRSARGARERVQIVTISTAGDAAARASSILGQMIDGNEGNGEIERPHGGLTISRDHEARLLVYNYSAPTTDPTDTAAMKLANPASFITEKFLAEQAGAADLSTAAVLQLHGCVWAETETTFVGPEVIAAARRRYADVDDGERGVLGFDGSERRDETWLVFCTMDGRLLPLGRWAKPQGSSEEWRVPRKDVHRAVDDAFARFDVVELAFDPPGWYAEGDQWEALYGERVVMFDTNKPARMAPACERVQAGLLGSEVSFGGPLAGVLAEHFANCNTRETTSGLVVTKDHPDSPRKIDGAVASIIAYERAMWHVANTSTDFSMWAWA